MTVLLVLMWLVCAVLAQGVGVAYFQAKYPTLAQEDFRTDLGVCLGMGLFGGPLALVIIYLMSGFAEHGLQWGRK